MKKRLFSFLLTVIIIFASLPTGAMAADTEMIYFDISKGNVIFRIDSVFGYDTNGKKVTKLNPDAIYVITGTSDKTAILVYSGTFNIALDNCNIDLSQRTESYAFLIKGTATVNLSVISDSTLKSGSKSAGIQYYGDTTLNIKNIPDLSKGTLYVYGGENAAGIGSGYCTNSGILNIYSGTIIAYGGKNAAAIGGGCSTGNNNVGNITIYNGNITAYGGESGCCIGNGVKTTCKKLDILGGNITAISNNSSGIHATSVNLQDIDQLNINVPNNTAILGSVSIKNTKADLSKCKLGINASSVNITSKSEVIAKSSSDCAAIRSNYITITDSIVIADSIGGAAAIGTAVDTKRQENEYSRIIINNSKVIASADSGGAAIGGGKGANFNNINIVNSEIYVSTTETEYPANAIGNGYNNIYSSCINIENSIISSQGFREIFNSYNTSNKNHSMILYENGVGTIEGNFILSRDYTIPEGYQLSVDENKTLKIAENVILYVGKGVLVNLGIIDSEERVIGQISNTLTNGNFILNVDGITTYYTNLSSALNYLSYNSGQNITLDVFKNTDGESIRFPAKKLTVNMNGYSISGGFNISITVDKGADITILNKSRSKTTLPSIKNEGNITVNGNITIDNNCTNKGGIFTLIDANISCYNYSAIHNSDNGTVNVYGGHIYGEIQSGYNDVGCTINIKDGGSFSTDYNGIKNYGTIYADNFKLYGYGTPLENIGGKVTLKNGEIYTHYGSNISNSNGDLYVENCELSGYESDSGISSSGTLYVKDSNIISTQFSFAGVNHSGTLTVENSTIDGGYNGLYLYEGTAKITNSQLGGGFYSYNGYGLYNGGEMTVKNCDITGGYGVGNSGTIYLKDTDINNLQWSGSESYAIHNSGNFYFDHGLINGGLAAYIDQGGTAEIKNAQIEGFDFSWNYDPMDLYGKEATFYMNGGSVTLYNNTLPEGFYVVTDKECETKYTIKDLIADKYKLYKTDDNSGVEFDDNTAMLDGTYYIEFDENQLPDFGASIAHINERNVTSEDIEAINAELSVVNEYNVEDYSEKTATKITKTKEKCNALLEIIVSVKEAIEIINGFAKELTAEEATTDTIDEIENIVSKAGTLLNGNNLSPSERSDIETAKTKLEEIISELAERKASIESALEGSEEITNSKPTTDDEERIITLIADINTLLSQNLTDEETAKLNSAKSRLEEKVSELADRKTAIESALERSEEIENGKTTTDDEEEINTLITNIENLLELELTEKQRTKLQTAKANALTALESFKQERNKLAELKTNFQQVNRKRVNIFDKKYLENLSKEIGLMISEGTLGGDDLDGAKRLKNEVDNLIELVQTPMFYGIIRIFWTIISMLKTIIL